MALLLELLSCLFAEIWIGVLVSIMTVGWYPIELGMFSINYINIAEK